jgi:hypothetical protein
MDSGLEGLLEPAHPLAMKMEVVSPARRPIPSDTEVVQATPPYAHPPPTVHPSPTVQSQPTTTPPPQTATASGSKGKGGDHTNDEDGGSGATENLARKKARKDNLNSPKQVLSPVAEKMKGKSIPPGLVTPGVQSLAQNTPDSAHKRILAVEERVTNMTTEVNGLSPRTNQKRKPEIKEPNRKSAATAEKDRKKELSHRRRQLPPGFEIQMGKGKAPKKKYLGNKKINQYCLEYLLDFSK